MLLGQVFFAAVRNINRDPSGAEWLTDNDLEGVNELIAGVIGTLVEANTSATSASDGSTATSAEPCAGTRVATHHEASSSPEGRPA